jgi:hypothetical protein
MIKLFAAAAASAVVLATAAAVPLPTLDSAAQARPTAACRDGKNRRVRMVNATRYTIERLYGSNVTRRSWEEDVLGDRVLRAGDGVTVNWDDGSCHCSFDIKAVYSDGDTSVKSGIDVCRLATFRFVE